MIAIYLRKNIHYIICVADIDMSEV